MYANPHHLDKYLYINKTPTWKVRILYFFGITSWLCVVYGLSGMFLIDPIYQWFVTPVILLITIYHFLSFGMNLFYRQFNLNKHFQYVKDYWSTSPLPSVNIFLPIAGEDLEVLRNTWKHVAQIHYQNKKVYVLDDSTEEIDEHYKLAHEFGFMHIERPNKGEMKKAGNLKYAYERTIGEFIVIFDADFAPHPNFITESLPYMSDPTVGIVQTPQFFNASESTYKQAQLAYAAAFQEELFYRIIQVAKDRFNAAICCGSNAVYRRRALDTIGGPRQVTASEDSRTGFALLSKGWITRYIPVILAVGVCPNNVYAYFHQQHRWCRGRSELVLSKEFLTASVLFVKKLCNLSGFLSFLLRPLEILLTFQLFWMLFLYNDSIAIGNSIIFHLYLIFSFLLLPRFHIAKFKKEVFLASAIQSYASMHSVISVFMGRTVGWIPTNAKHTTISPAFHQTTRIVKVYVIMYLLLILLAFRTDDIHLLNINYWSIQFWMLWNFLLTSIFLLKLINTKRAMTGQPSILNRLNPLYAPMWQLAVFSFIIGLMIGIPISIHLMSKTNLRGVQSQALAVQSLPSITPTKTPNPTTTVTLTPTRKPAIRKRTQIIKKEYGGWYWQSELGRSQRWLGTDSQGKDIWSDSEDTVR